MIGARPKMSRQERRMIRLAFSNLVVAGLLVCAIGVVPAQAQLMTQHIRGATGLKSASQPPPHWYLVLPLVYVYNTDTVKDRDGDKLPGNASITTVAYATGIAKVTTRKLFGGFYGFQVMFPVGANNRLQGTEIDANPGGGLSDSVIQPLWLGWHFK